MISYKVILSLLLFLAACVPFVVLKRRQQGRPLDGGRSSKVDVFSPAVAFPMAYAFIYSVGSFELSPHSLSIPAEQYFYYFLGLGGYFCGLLFAEKIYSPAKAQAVESF